MSKSNIKFVIIVVSIIAIALWLHHYSISEKACKRYIVKHRNEIIYNSDPLVAYNNFSLKGDDIGGGYYDEITISQIDSQSYHVICWGRRDSWLWGLKSDKSFERDVLFAEYNGEDVSQDVAIVSILNKIKSRHK